MPFRPPSTPCFQPLIVAHRGLWFGRFAENSTEAFDAAADAGFLAECDVWALADGEPVVIHDPTLDRTTTGSGPVSALTAAQLRDVRVRHPDSRTAPVPLLADIADRVYLVEIKPPDAAALVRRVIEVMSGRTWVLQSFDALNLAHAAATDPALPLALLAYERGSVSIATEKSWNAHLYHEMLSDPVAALPRGRGLRVGAWTVNSPKEIAAAISSRADVIISDHPHRVRAALLGQRERSVM